MPRYKIGWDMGYGGCKDEDIIEAEEVAWDIAMGHVSIWAEEIDEKKEE